MKCNVCGIDGNRTKSRGAVKVRAGEEGLCLLCELWYGSFKMTARLRPEAGVVGIRTLALLNSLRVVLASLLLAVCLTGCGSGGSVDEQRHVSVDVAPLAGYSGAYRATVTLSGLGSGPLTEGTDGQGPAVMEFSGVQTGEISITGMAIDPPVGMTAVIRGGE